jgi:hypothetical protein
VVGPLIARGDGHVADIAVAVGTRLEALVFVAFDKRLGEAIGASVREVEHCVLTRAALEDGLRLVPILLRCSNIIR